jgi:5-methylcytosine-specific restriction enzyme A
VGRLKQMAPMLGAMQARVGYLPETEFARRRAANPLRALYNTARWQAVRWQVLVDALFTCARCGRLERDTSRLVADHKVPHRGDLALFWDRGNLQCLCKPCHDRDKQRDERRGMA